MAPVAISLTSGRKVRSLVMNGINFSYQHHGLCPFPSQPFLTFEWTTVEPRQSDKCREKSKEKKPRVRFARSRPVRNLVALSLTEQSPQDSSSSVPVQLGTWRPVAFCSCSDQMSSGRPDALVSNTEISRHPQDAHGDTTEHKSSERPDANPVGRDWR